MNGADGATRSLPTIVLFTNSWMMGGMEQHVLTLGRGLTSRGIRVAAVCPDDEAIEPMRSGLDAVGARVYALPGDRRGPLSLLRRLGELRAVLRAHRPFILHLHITGSNGGFLPMLAAKAAGASGLIRTEHQPPEYPVSLRQRALIQLRDRALDRIICVSRANLEQHVRDIGRSRGKFTSIANCIDLETYDPSKAGGQRVRDLAGAEDGSLVIGTLGRLAEPRKGAEYFVDMAKILSAERDNYVFLMVGEGPRRPQLEQRAEGKVVFLGRYPDAAECYAAMDVFVQASLWEGGPITTLEAMAMERPVVATNVGMVPEVIRHGVNGCVVPPGDAHALAGAVRWLTEDPRRAREVARQARTTIQSEYSEDVMVERTIQVYAGLRGAPARPKAMPAQGPG